VGTPAWEAGADRAADTGDPLLRGAALSVLVLRRIILPARRGLARHDRAAPPLDHQIVRADRRGSAVGLAVVDADASRCLPVRFLGAARGSAAAPRHGGPPAGRSRRNQAG